MRRTGWADLAVPFAVLAVAVYLVLRAGYDSLPPLRYAVPIPVAALAVVEFVVARRVRAAVRHDPHAKAMTAIAVARCVALGKASALVGAAVAGAAVALSAYLLPDVAQIDAARHDATVGVLLLAAALALVGAGMLVERSGIDPGSDSPRRSGYRDRD